MTCHMPVQDRERVSFYGLVNTLWLCSFAPCFCLICLFWFPYQSYLWLTSYTYACTLQPLALSYVPCQQLERLFAPLVSNNLSSIQCDCNLALCSDRYSHDRDRSPEAAGNMKKVLAHLKNLPLKKSIAQQLGMNDLLQTLSSTYNEGFLNDIARL